MPPTTPSSAATLVAALQNSGYFRIVKTVASEAEANELIEAGEVQFVRDHPAELLGRKLMRGEHPALLLTADATDPAATSNARRRLPPPRRGGPGPRSRRPAGHLRRGATAARGRSSTPASTPRRITQYNIVPGLMGVVLTMTLVIITALAITRERERGTMENLLSTPVQAAGGDARQDRPLHPRRLPADGRSFWSPPATSSRCRWPAACLLLLAVSLLFIAANLGVGLTFSTLARNQLQAVQMAFFFFLPSILLSGFMFPFRGMPAWAQYVGEILPLTHYLRIVRGILLKGNGLAEVLPHLWPIALFLLVALSIGLKRYRQTLD